MSEKELLHIASTQKLTDTKDVKATEVNTTSVADPVAAPIHHEEVKLQPSLNPIDSHLSSITGVYGL
jgi:hypothetical protein